MTLISDLSPFGVSLLGIGGVLLTQIRADRRDRIRQKEAWAREDEARSYERRSEAYIEFVSEYNRLWRAAIVEDESQEAPRPSKADAWFETLEDRIIQIEIFGSQQAAEYAVDALEALMASTSTPGDVEWAPIHNLNAAIRRDLSIPDRTVRPDIWARRAEHLRSPDRPG